MHTSGSAKPTVVAHVSLGAVFYNIGFNAMHVQTPTLYRKWLSTNLRRDVLCMVEEFEMDIMCLSGLGTIIGSFQKAVAQWMESGAAKLGRQPLMERRMLELVDK